MRRDKHRGNKTSTIEKYKQAIHRAVNESKGKDYYTCEKLRWDLISQYDNLKSSKGKREYKKKFAKVPSVDHIGGGK